MEVVERKKRLGRSDHVGRKTVRPGQSGQIGRNVACHAVKVEHTLAHARVVEE